jgi:hypothetical protein
MGTYNMPELAMIVWFMCNFFLCDLDHTILNGKEINFGLCFNFKLYLYLF